MAKKESIIVDFYDNDCPCYLRVRIKRSDFAELKAINTRIHKKDDFNVDDLTDAIKDSGMKHKIIPNEGDVALFF